MRALTALTLLAVLATSCSTPEQARPSETPVSTARTAPPTGPVLSKVSIAAKFGEQGIRVSTVRTHIKNVRQKTGRGSVREIVRELSRMPQIVSSLRLVAQD